MGDWVDLEPAVKIRFYFHLTSLIARGIRVNTNTSGNDWEVVTQEAFEERRK